MSRKVRYEIDYDKTIETIVWLAHQKPNIDIYHVAKVLFYADKMHINRYARPITADVYIKVEYGPLPSGTRDLITKNDWLSPDHLCSVSDALEINNEKYKNIAAKREPDLNYFSKTDIECLTEALDKYGNLSFDELYKLSHAEKCYYETDINAPIDYLLMVDDDNPNKDEIIAHMEEISQYVQV